MNSENKLALNYVSKQLDLAITYFCFKLWFKQSYDFSWVKLFLPLYRVLPNSHCILISIKINEKMYTKFCGIEFVYVCLIYVVNTI